MIASAVLLIIVGLWFLLQTLAGGLPRRVLSWRKLAASTKTPGAVA